jgi:hypothetical protein
MECLGEVNLEKYSVIHDPLAVLLSHECSLCMKMEQAYLRLLVCKSNLFIDLVFAFLRRTFCRWPPPHDKQVAFGADVAERLALVH